MTRVADDVLGKVARQQADVFNRVRTGGLSLDRFFRAMRQMLDCLQVQVEPWTWTKAVEAGGYATVCIDSKFTQADLPAYSLEEIRGEVEINLRHKHENMTTQQRLDSLDYDPASKEKFAHPLQVLAIGYNQSTKDEQRDNPISTVWVSPRTGQLWYLILSGNAGFRSLHVRYQPCCWSACYRAAAVVK